MNYFKTLCPVSAALARVTQNMNPQFGSLECCPNWKETACWRSRWGGTAQEKAPMKWIRRWALRG